MPSQSGLPASGSDGLMDGVSAAPRVGALRSHVGFSAQDKGKPRTHLLQTAGVTPKVSATQQSWVSQAAGVPCICIHRAVNDTDFFLFLKRCSHYIAQAGFRLLGLSDFPISASPELRLQAGATAWRLFLSH